MTTKVSPELTLLIHHSLLDKSGINAFNATVAGNIHFKAGSLEDAAKKGKHLKHRVWRRHITGINWALEGLFIDLDGSRTALWSWPASQEQMAARPGVKFDLNAEIQNSESTRIALLKNQTSPYPIPCQGYRSDCGFEWKCFDHYGSVCKIAQYLGHVFLL